MLWAQPEVALYDRYDHTDRPGYPDFIQDYVAHSNGGAAGSPDADTSNGTWTVLLTETQKTAARIHRIDDDLINGLLSQHYLSAVPAGAINLRRSSSVAEPTFTVPTNASAPSDGFSIGLQLETPATPEAEVLVTTMGSIGFVTFTEFLLSLDLCAFVCMCDRCC